MTKEELKQYLTHLERLSSEASYAETMKIEAEEKVREDERRKRDLEKTKTAILKGYSNEAILDFTDLTIEEIEEIRKGV